MAVVTERFSRDLSVFAWHGILSEYTPYEADITAYSRRKYAAHDDEKTRDTAGDVFDLAIGAAHSAARPAEVDGNRRSADTPLYRASV